MNDPGLDEAIRNSNQAAAETELTKKPSSSGTTTLKSLSPVPPAKTPSKHSEKRQNRLSHKRELIREELKHDDEEEVYEYYQKTLWWFTSTVFPLIAGTFGPIANLFSVCSIAQTWKFHTDTLRRIPDPAWVVGLNALSIFLAFWANLILLFNFARRVPYKIAQPLTITLWYSASIVLIVPLALTSSSAVPTHALSQSFWYGLIGCVIHVAVSTLLLINTVCAYKFEVYAASFNSLTLPQRSLMLQTMSFSLYLALGGWLFSHLEHWGFTDGVYWADYTVLTIGLGSDFPLKRTVSRMILMPYAAFGITFVGLVVCSVRGLVLERAKVKVVRRHLGKERQKWLTRIKESQERQKKRSGGGGQNDTPESLWSRMRSKGRRASILKEVKHIPALAEQQVIYDRGAWRKAEFELMRYVEARAESAQRYTALCVSIFVFLLVWLGGALIFWRTEQHQHWTYPESMFFTYTSILTIGYGDFFPTSSAGKPFFVIWSLVAVPTVTVLISNLGDTVVKGLTDATIWIGSKTVLPERVSSLGTKVRRKKRKGRRREKRKKKAAEDTEASSMEPERPPLEEKDAFTGDIEHIGEAIVEAEENRGHGDSLAARLAREIKELTRDVRRSPPPKYDWEDWVRWLDLLAEGTECADGDETHVRRALNERMSERVRRGETLACPIKHGAKVLPEVDEFGIPIVMEGEQGPEWTWTWLSDKGPLFSRESEPEWIIFKLCERLEEVLEEELAERS